MTNPTQIPRKENESLKPQVPEVEPQVPAVGSVATGAGSIASVPYKPTKQQEKEEELLFMDSDEVSAASLHAVGSAAAASVGAAGSAELLEPPLHPTHSGKQLPAVMQLSTAQHQRKKTRKKRAASSRVAGRTVLSEDHHEGGGGGNGGGQEDQEEDEEEYDALDGFLTLQDQLLKLGLGQHEKEGLEGDSTAPALALATADSSQQLENSGQDQPPAPSQPAFVYPPASQQDFNGEKQMCLEILDLIMQNECSQSFHFPVDPVALGLPDYHLVVKKPQDFTSVKNRVESMVFASAIPTTSPSSIINHHQIPLQSPLDVLIDGVGQTLQNCYLYNPKGNPIRKDAWFLIAYFDHLLHTYKTGRLVNWRLYWGIEDFRAYHKIVNDKRRGPNRKSSGRYPVRKNQQAAADAKSALGFGGGGGMGGKRKRGSGMHRNGSYSSMADASMGAHAGLYDDYDDGAKKRRLNVAVFSQATACFTLLHSILAASTSSIHPHSHHHEKSASST